MSLLNSIRILGLHRNIITPLQNTLQVNGYAVSALTGKTKRLGKKGQIAEKKKLPVETDVNKLINYCCGSNYFVEGEDVKLKPDSEYPDWLWNLHVGPRLPKEELDKNSKAYWRRMREEGITRKLRLNNYTKVKRY